MAYLGILCTSDYELSIRGVFQAGHIVEMSLLFENVRLALPFPHDELSQSLAAQRQPVALLVERHSCYHLIRNAATKSSQTIIRENAIVFLSMGLHEQHLKIRWEKSTLPLQIIRIC